MQAIVVERRTLLRGAGATAVAWAAGTAWSPAAAKARQPLIAVLVHGTAEPNRPRVDALRAGLHALGCAEGRNCRIEMRWSDARAERLPELAQELLAPEPDVVVTQPVLAAQAVHPWSTTVPIVMASQETEMKVVAFMRSPPRG